MDLCVPYDPKSIKRECMILLEKVTVAYQSLCTKKMKVLISDDEEMVYTKKLDCYLIPGFLQYCKRVLGFRSPISTVLVVLISYHIIYCSYLWLR